MKAASVKEQLEPRARSGPHVLWPHHREVEAEPVGRDRVVNAYRSVSQAASMRASASSTRRPLRISSCCVMGLHVAHRRPNAARAPAVSPPKVRPRAPERGEAFVWGTDALFFPGTPVYPDKQEDVHITDDPSTKPAASPDKNAPELYDGLSIVAVCSAAVLG